jgi:ribonuclease-3
MPASVWWWRQKGGGQEDLDQLQRILGYRFRDRTLLREALTHPSYRRQGAAISHERLEWLGESLLSTLLTEELCLLYPSRGEGDLTAYRSALSSGRFLAELAREYSIDRYVRRQAVPGQKGRDSEQALEAVVGAIFLDSRYGRMRQVVLRWYEPMAKRLEAEMRRNNPKGRVQELISSLQPNSILDYRLIAEKGEDHGRTYSVALYCEKELLGIGSGTSKKVAEKNAAFHALEIILRRTNAPR